MSSGRIRHDEAVFLEEIAADLSNLEARLIYADWLEEQGDPRAALIRVQCELAELSTAGADDNWRAELQRQEAELLPLYREKVLSLLASCGIRDVRIEGGFVTKAYLVGTGFLIRGRLLARVAPLLQAVMLRGVPLPESTNAITAVMEGPGFVNLRSLDASATNFTKGATHALATSKRLAQLETLLLADNSLNGEPLRALAESPSAAGLKRLDITGNQLSAFDARTLAKATFAPGLSILRLNQNAIDDAGLKTLAHYSDYHELRELGCARAGITSDGLRGLAESRRLTQLESLDLSGNPIGAAGAAVLASSSNFSRLKRLAVAGCELDQEAAEMLVRSQYLSNLTDLDLRNNDCERPGGSIARFGQRLQV